MAVGGDLAFEEVADEAACTCFFHILFELLFGDAGYFAGHFHFALGDLTIVESDVATAFERLRGKACAAEYEGKLHRIAAGMCCGYQFFGVGAYTVFKTAFVGVLGFVEHSAL